MAKAASTAVNTFLEALPADRRDALATVRQVILKALPAGYVERLSGNFINYEVSLERYPNTYNGQPLAFAALASQKNYCALYLISAYQDPEAEHTLRAGFKAAGKKLDMGKSCIRFREADDLALDVIGAVVRDSPVMAFVAQHESARGVVVKSKAKRR
jgi:hypothetical protein